MSSSAARRTAEQGLATLTKARFRNGSSASWKDPRKTKRKGGPPGEPTTRAARRAASFALKEKAAKELQKAKKREKGREEEWEGIKSEEDEEDEEEAEGDEEGSEGEDEDYAPEPTPVKVKKEKRPTGGTGRKPKVFVQEKSDLLALAASITGDAEEKRQAKIERALGNPVKNAPPPKNPLQAAKQKQLDAARAIVAARTKAKKDQQKAEAAPKPAASALPEGKKRVSFA